MYEDAQTITFESDMPEGYIAQLMYGNLDRLVDGAFDPTRYGVIFSVHEHGWGILVSCIDSHLLMGQKLKKRLMPSINYGKSKCPQQGLIRMDKSHLLKNRLVWLSQSNHDR